MKNDPFKISFFQAVIISLIILISFSYLVLYSTDPYLRLVASDLFNSITPILVSIGLYYAAKSSRIHSKRIYLAWIFFSAAMFSWGLGEITWTTLELILLQEPFPSLADVFYLGLYPLFLTGILYLPSKRMKRSEYLTMFLDMSIIMISALIIFWNFLIWPNFTPGGADSLLSAILSAAYPIGDLLLIFGLLMLIFRPLEKTIKGPLILLIFGVMAMIISDSLFVYQSLTGTYVSGSPIDAGWMVSFILIGLAGILQGERMQLKSPSFEYSSKKEISGKITSLPNYLTYFWILIPFFLLIWSHYYKINTEFYILALSVGIIIVLIIIRQILTLRDNKNLYEQLQRGHDELEIRVKQRTEDLVNTNLELKKEVIERKKAEEELKLKAKLLDAANDSIMLHDLDGNPLYMNESAYKSLGYTREEMMQINIREMESPAEGKKMPSRMQELMEKGYVFFESENMRKDGSIRPIEVYTQLIEVGDQKLMLGTARDISERKKAESQLKAYQKNLEEMVKVRTHALKEANMKLKNEINERKKIQEKLEVSESMYRSIFENTGTATVIIEDDATISLANGEFEKLSGYSKEEIENNKKWTEFVVDEDLPYMTEQHRLRRINPRKAAKIYEFRFIDKKGEIKNIHLSVDMFPGTKKSIASLIDVTRLKDAETKIKKSLKEKEVLLREIHHRVKNNMQIISSLLSIQSRYIDDEETRSIFRESQNRVRSMSMVHEKLYQSQDLAQINLREYIKSITSELLVSFRSQQDNINIHINFENIWLNMDTVVPCGLIITELVTNSLKYAFPDDIAGEINIDLKDLGNQEYLLSVADDGIGLPDDLDISDSDTIGLMLINSLVRQLDGTITVDTSHGTLFKIKFSELKYKNRI